MRTTTVLVSKGGDFRQLAFLYGAPPKVASLQIVNLATFCCRGNPQGGTRRDRGVPDGLRRGATSTERKEVAGLPQLLAVSHPSQASGAVRPLLSLS